MHAKPAVLEGFRGHCPARSTVNEKRQSLNPTQAHQNMGAKQNALGTHAPQMENTKVNAEQNSSYHEKQ